VDPNAPVDLHVHSTASDGALPPAALVDAASRNGLAAIAISDHDTLDGLREADSAATGKDLLFIPSVELSINLVSGGSAHLLGYFPSTPLPLLLDPSGDLGRALASVRAARDERNPRIIARLAQMGYTIFEEEVLEKAGGSVVGRPHIAQALVARGYVQSCREAFDRLLARGKPAYVERERLWEANALDLIMDLRGVPVLAHPGLLERDQTGISALLRSLAGRGLAGVEAFYPRHSPDTTSFLVREAEAAGLFTTGGTDFHGSPDDPAGLGGTPGVFSVRVAHVSRFLEMCAGGRREVTCGDA